MPDEPLPFVIRTLHERLHFRYHGPQRLGRFVAFAVAAKSPAAGVEFSLKDIDTKLDRRNLHVNFNPLNEVCRSEYALLSAALICQHLQ